MKFLKALSLMVVMLFVGLVIQPQEVKADLIYCDITDVTRSGSDIYVEGFVTDFFGTGYHHLAIWIGTGDYINSTFGFETDTDAEDSFDILCAGWGLFAQGTQINVRAFPNGSTDPADDDEPLP